MGGKGKLTKKVIESIQTYYGLAIRNNCNNIYAMKKAIGAILYHCTNFTNREQRHAMCPRDENTWCKWHSAKLKGENPPKEKINLPLWIHAKIKPIFKDLSDDELLSKCTHGQTQNAQKQQLFGLAAPRMSLFRDLYFKWQLTRLFYILMMEGKVLKVYYISLE